MVAMYNLEVFQKLKYVYCGESGQIEDSQNWPEIAPSGRYVAVQRMPVPSQDRTLVKLLQLDAVVMGKHRLKHKLAAIFYADVFLANTISSASGINGS